MKNVKQLLAVSLAAVSAGAVHRGEHAVRAEGGDATAILSELTANFKAFKEAQDNRIEELKANAAKPEDIASAKAESKEMIDALQASVDDLATQIAAGQMNGKGASREAKAKIEAVSAYMRSGDVRADLNKGSDTDGGYLVPTEWDRTITDKLIEISPLRQLMRVIPTSKSTFSKLYNLHGTNSGWVGETDSRPKTDTSKFASLKFETGEIYANPAATQQMLDDAETDLESWLSEEVQTEFSSKENAAFVTGDGAVGKPTGILTYVTGGANATKHPLGAIETVASGDAAAITADALIDLVYELPAAFSQGAAFIMNRKTLAIVRKLKDGQGNYLWQPSFQAGQPSTVLGYPVYEVAEMPDVAANALPILFGDLKRAYLILDRIGVRILRDPYTNKPYVQFYTTKRVGGGLDNPEAIRALKVSA